MKTKHTFLPAHVFHSGQRQIAPLPPERSERKLRSHFFLMRNSLDLFVVSGLADRDLDVMHVLSADSCDFSGFSLAAGCSPPEGLGETKARCVRRSCARAALSVFTSQTGELRGGSRCWRLTVCFCALGDKFRTSRSHLGSFSYNYRDSVLSEICARDQQSVF